MKTLVEVIQLSSEYLKTKGIERAKREAEDLIAFALQYKRSDLCLNFDQPLEEKELEAIRQLIKKRAQGIPLEYVTEEKRFFNLHLKVTPDVLIPRHETEILVDLIIKDLENQALENKILLDMGTGSGAIGLALKKQFPLLKVILLDQSEKALAIAKENAKKNGLDVSFLQSDCLSQLQEKIDFVVSNPPYISKRDFDALDPSVKDYEPKQALLAGATGLEVYKRLEQDLNKYLHKHGKVYFEIGHDQKEALDQLYSSPFWVQKNFFTDYASKNRFFFLETE